MKIKITCIYKILNTTTKKVYIGQTINYLNRVNKHRYDLRNNKSYCRKLQHSWSKHGESNFIFEVLEECTKDQLNEKEKYYIELYDSIVNGYNLEKGGRKGKELSQETKELMSINNPRAWEGKKWGEHNISKQIHQYTLEGDYIQSFGNAYEAAKVLGVHNKVIQSSAREGVYNQSAHGFQWSYEKVDNIGKYVKRKAKVVNSKPVNMICPTTGTVLKSFESASEAQQYLGQGKNKIFEVCKGARQHWAGYKWNYR